MQVERTNNSEMVGGGAFEGAEGMLGQRAAPTHQPIGIGRARLVTIDHVLVHPAIDVAPMGLWR
ncbi:MAG: hypothetical protein JWM91_238 [Rhodospirillales bacterium]|nr:hypothetical protein [Rhodospirillales bacterium]